ncbi:MAG: methylenetetrahydrofolate reductase, partial [Actinomycetaceae bacterium]|nr:methylenetetrahydrofolate reductase [Actinomycetaceae bacterium]
PEEDRSTHTLYPDEGRHVSASKFAGEDIDREEPYSEEEIMRFLQESAGETRIQTARFKNINVLPSTEKPTLSLEVFPSRSLKRLRANVASIRKMLTLGADFMTVTYGAAGSKQEGTKEIVTWLAQAGVPTFAHLTCHADSLSQLDATIDELLELGVTGILALRGDERGDGKHLVLEHATDLIARIRKRGESAGMPIKIAVAAFPNGHPESRDLDEDALTIARKHEAGADFAITQHFFSAADYTRFVELVGKHGSDLPIVPGLTPITSYRRLARMCELASVEIPANLARALQEAGENKDACREIAIETTVELACELSKAGAPGIQLFTMNDDSTAASVITRIAPFFGKK